MTASGRERVRHSANSASVGAVGQSGGATLPLRRPLWPEIDHLAPDPERVEMIRPPPHHLHPLVPMLTTCIGAANSIALEMCQLAFDRVRVPQAAFVQEC